MKVAHEFVEEVPSQLANGVIYVSIPYATAVHKCCCGCGLEVVTPLSPTDWELRFNGAAVSLWPSIGNWSFPCRSHYWIEKGRVRWAAQMSDAEIRSGRQHDRRAKDLHYGESLTTPPEEKPLQTSKALSSSDGGLVARLKTWWFGR